jgi:CBS domain containing-hemolysin-like protein
LDPDLANLRGRVGTIILLFVAFTAGLLIAQTDPTPEANADTVITFEQAEAQTPDTDEPAPATIIDEGAEPEALVGASILPTEALIIAAIMLLFCSGFFSGSETALFSLSKVQTAQLERKDKLSRADRAVLRLLSDRKDTLITILIGNMMINVAIALVIGAITARFFAESFLLSFLVGSVLATLAVLIVGEIFPKSLAIEHAESFARLIAIPLSSIRKVFTPLRFTFKFITEIIFRLLNLPAEDDSEAVTEQEIKGLVTMGQVEGLIQDDEREMIDSVFDFNDEIVEKIMTPRVALQAYSLDVDRQELEQGLLEGGHSRVLIYGDSLDDIRGVVHLKDVLLNPDKGLDELMRQPLIVPEKKKLSDLLNDFRKSHQHLAVVVDEYGGTEGCISLSDVLEQIFGDLLEVGDTGTLKLQKISRHVYEMNGLYRIDDLNDELNLKLPEDEATTVSGLINSILGDFPKPNTKVEINGLEFTVLKMGARRIARARLKLPASLFGKSANDTIDDDHTSPTQVAV